MFVFRPHVYWIVGIILAVQFAYALPPNIPPDYVPDPLVPRGFSIPKFNSTNAQCVAGVGVRITKFFIFNYIGHAFTIKPGAGYKTIYVLTFAVAAIFLPYYGLLLACRGMETCAVNEENMLKRAGRGGALCVVARTKKWRPRPGDKAWCWRSAPDENTEAAEVVNYAGLELEYLPLEHVQVHGMCHLPAQPREEGDGSESNPPEDEGEYMLARLPPHYEVEWSTRDVPNHPGAIIPDTDASISSDYSVIRPVMAFFQLLTAVPTIYQAHDPESRASHGYAGYQLTVIPFALMSIINTFTSFTTPSYGASYMVSSDIMEEAKRRGGVFEGVVGKLSELDGRVSLGPLAENPDHKDIIGEVGEFKADAGDDIYIEFNGSRIRYPGPKEPKKENPALRALRKTSHFLFRQHIWETLREEFPVLRWFLYSYELKLFERILEEHNRPSADQTLEVGEIGPSETPDTIEKKGATQANEVNTTGAQDLDLTKIVRVNPQRTCITRLFKRYSGRKLKDGRSKTTAMLLFPAIGHPKPREKDKGEKFMYYFTDAVFVLSIMAPYLITYGLTRYEPGESHINQRVIVVLWLVVMQIACIPQRVVWNFLQTRLVPLGSSRLNWGLYFVVAAGILWSAPGVIGYLNILHLIINDNKNACSGIFADAMNALGVGTSA